MVLYDGGHRPETEEERVEVAQRAAQAKAKVGQPARDPEREAELLLERQAKAEELGLDGLSTAEVFRAILGFSRLHQDNADA